MAFTSITPYKAGGLGARVDPAEYRKRAQGELSALYGDVQLSNIAGGMNLDAWSSHNAIKSGLAFELSGRATIVQARVASHLTSFDDPLKVLMPPQVVESDTIVVKRRIVTGHNAEVVPESAPARAVRVRTEEVEVTLNRCENCAHWTPFGSNDSAGTDVTSRWTPTCSRCPASTRRTLT